MNDNGTGPAEKKRPPRRSLKPRRQDRQTRPDDDFNWNRVLKVVLSWSAIILVVFLVMSIFKNSDTSEIEITYTEYLELLHSDLILEATIKKSDLIRTGRPPKLPT